ncbi:hypothetical protein METBIDRAFT_32616 [Metschnikowia bicuspidata var. bicuspidata NRRL YB-4993]|uniref:Uncharacterized protein n=1 Tax=Metschnikowia bicuspidata var. bicuspidata NRRL YB-4993 TaxID=869754 RepID=A0A1A0H9T8_9ASCO|nr:hypothetical protein METBIDRAFT_32616 [Metschnikowia bicuspidata var. bicuspidata NRRL YB-4993]OBA20647.1 hypothetical protein METBIDRAFT_32616 [Metschnikowia bicuspidata var. bicuspidata NRRL YB-4993]
MYLVSKVAPPPSVSHGLDSPLGPYLFMYWTISCQERAFRAQTRAFDQACLFMKAVVKYVFLQTAWSNTSGNKRHGHDL